MRSLCWLLAVWIMCCWSRVAAWVMCRVVDSKAWRASEA